jgi:hypothetical protein
MLAKIQQKTLKKSSEIFFTMKMLSSCKVGKKISEGFTKVQKYYLLWIGTLKGIFANEVYALHLRINMVRKNFRWMVLAEFCHFHCLVFFSFSTGY